MTLNHFQILFERISWVISFLEYCYTESQAGCWAVVSVGWLLSPVNSDCHILPSVAKPVFPPLNPMQRNDSPAHKAGTSERRRTQEQRAACRRGAASPELNIEQPFALAGGGGSGWGAAVKCRGEFRGDFLVTQIREPNKIRIILKHANWKLING